MSAQGCQRLLEAANRGDWATAREEIRPLAEQGEVRAQFFMAVIYDGGLGIPQDYAEASKWFRLAAEQGHARAQVGLAFMYRLGHGVTRDYVQAHMWINLAAASLPLGEERDDAASFRAEVENHMTPEQITEAQRLAREWKPK